MDDTARQKVKARVNRIAGQVAGVQRMIDEDKYCVDILNQIAAVCSALDALGVDICSRTIWRPAWSVTARAASTIAPSP